VSEQVARNASADDSQHGGVRKVYHEPSEPVDLLAVAGAPLARRAAPVVAGGLIAALIAGLVVRRRRRR